MYEKGMVNENKKIIYWGAGNIGQRCLKYHTELDVAFFVDSGAGKNVICGKEIKSPEQISDWKNYYVIIAVKKKETVEQISNYLEKNGLTPDEDFCTYEKYFQCAQSSVEGSLELLLKYVESTPNACSATVIIALPAMQMRNAKGFHNFAAAYAKARKPQNCLFFSNWSVMSPEEMSQKLSGQAFCLPDFDSMLPVALSEEDDRWLKELKNRKIDGYSDETDKQIRNMMFYYDAAFKILKPQKVLFWGSWILQSYIVQYIAQKHQIICGFLEYGWLPGTYQIDPLGLMGQGELSAHPNLIKELKVEEVYNIQEIKQYIIQEKLDSRVFYETKEDKESIEKLDTRRKTVFLVGMSDYVTQMNPKSEYWKSYVSSNVESTEDALVQLLPVCRKRGWNLIFKPHPVSRISEWIKESKELILVRDMEIDKLIQLADVVVSIASAVDFKVLIYGKPLVQLGMNALRGAECTYYVHQMNQLEDKLVLAMEQGITKEQIKNYDHLLQLLLQYYLWDDLAERKIRYGLPVERDFYGPLNGLQ